METINLSVTIEELKDILNCLEFASNDVSEKEADLLALKSKLEGQAGTVSIQD